MSKFEYDPELIRIYTNELLDKTESNLRPVDDWRLTAEAGIRWICDVDAHDFMNDIERVWNKTHEATDPWEEASDSERHRFMVTLAKKRFYHALDLDTSQWESQIKEVGEALAEKQTENDTVPLRDLTPPDIAFLLKLQHEMLTQDHLCQADPRYWVIRDEREEICWSEYADRYLITNTDGDTLGYSDQELYDCPDNIRYIPVRTVEFNVEGPIFLTMKEAQEHIKANSHHYNKPRPYAETAWRCPDEERLWKLLQEIDWAALSKNLS